MLLTPSPQHHPRVAAPCQVSRLSGKNEPPRIPGRLIAVCVDGRLVGIVGIERLLAAAPDIAVDRLMDHDPPVVAPNTDQEIAAWVMLEHGEGSLAIVDNDGIFLGLIAPKRILSVLLQEHEEDLSRFSGLLATGNTARIASEERVTRRLATDCHGLRSGCSAR